VYKQIIKYICLYSNTDAADTTTTPITMTQILLLKREKNFKTDEPKWLKVKNALEKVVQMIQQQLYAFLIEWSIGQHASQLHCNIYTDKASSGV